RDKIGIEVELEADRMANAILDGPTFENEKAVVMEERRLRTDDNPDQALAEIANAVMYMVYPYRRPVIGWMSDILNLTRDDLVQHYKTYYSPNNAFIVAVGDFSSDEMLAKIKQEFGKVARRSDPPAVKLEEPPQQGARRAQERGGAAAALGVLSRAEFAQPRRIRARPAFHDSRGRTQLAPASRSGLRETDRDGRRRRLRGLHDRAFDGGDD